ncbi:MAG: TatD family hydrolase [Aminipila sp.]
MIFDSHTHIDMGVGLGIGIENTNPKELGEFKSLIEGKELGVLANAACASEYDELSKIEGIFISFGIHPWNVNDFCSSTEYYNNSAKLSKMESYYKKAHAIGEIGMDSVWCDCDLELQKEIFINQLKIAESLQKPIVLHTKGQEKEIAEILKSYSVRKLVHWYSCEQYIDDFIEQDCFFTVGPNYKTSPAVKKVISLVPLDRLLVETDGISAVEWAASRKIKAEEIPTILRETMEAIADEKKVAILDVEEALEQNFHRFIGI